MTHPIYLDNHATTPCDPRVVEKMLPYFSNVFGNAASRNHEYGDEAAKALEEARGHVAKLIGVSSQEIIFTSGSTESIHIAVNGVAEAYREKGNHIITAATEHRAVVNSIRALESKGLDVTVLDVDAFGRINVDALKKAVTSKTILIAVMAANNEIGTFHPFQEIGQYAKEKGIIFLCDAVQAVGKMELNADHVGIDLLPISAHKIYGPKGIGALYVRKKDPRVRLAPTVFGGGQERGLRSGTVNVPGAVGFGEACRLISENLEGEISHYRRLRDQLLTGITSQLDGVRLNGHPSERLPNNLSLSFEGVDGEALVRLIRDEVAISTGATCTSTSIEPSHVLKAIGLIPELAKATLRFGVGRANTENEIRRAIDRVVQSVKSLRR